MLPKNRIPGLAVEDIPADIKLLGQRIAALPADLRHDLEAVYGHVLAGAQRRRRIIAMAQDALAQLRLDVKYLIFDLEATRREKEALEQLLDERQS